MPSMRVVGQYKVGHFSHFYADKGNYGSPGKGWKYVWHPEDPKEYYHFETVECLYKHLFSKHGVLERFGPMFCHSDIINYGNLHNIDFIRTKTLCQGGDCCDFCFVRHRNGEIWERTKSI